MNLDKFKSRKFLLTLASILTGLGTLIGGIATGNPEMIVGGIGMMGGTTAVYTYSEAKVDASSVASETTQHVVTAESTDKALVASVLTPTDSE